MTTSKYCSVILYITTVFLWRPLRSVIIFITTVFLWWPLSNVILFITTGNSLPQRPPLLQQRLTICQLIGSCWKASTISRSDSMWTKTSTTCSTVMEPLPPPIHRTRIKSTPFRPWMMMRSIMTFHVLLLHKTLVTLFVESRVRWIFILFYLIQADIIGFARFLG